MRLYFGQGAEDPKVLRTEPAAGTPITRGLTVKVYVTGPAPLLTLPVVVGQQCNVGGKALADAGVYPQYPTGRAGVVVKTDPAADATTVHWNDTVKVTCARPGTSPSPVPSQSGSPGRRRLAAAGPVRLGGVALHRTLTRAVTGARSGGAAPRTAAHCRDRAGRSPAGPPVTRARRTEQRNLRWGSAGGRQRLRLSVI